MRTPTTSSFHQHGAALLIVSMLLLFSSSIVVFYLNRGLIFEQKTSANQVRSTSAQEAAEAGIEWATGKLNTPVDIQESDCEQSSTTNVSFRKIYAQTAATNVISSSSYAYPGCKMSGTTLTCNCPAAPPTTNNAGTQQVSVANLGTNVLPGFTVTFADVPGDNEAVQITSTGCTAQAGACKALTTLEGAPLTAANAAATTGAADATATISVILKMRQLIRGAPASPLTCGSTCALNGSFSVENFNVATNGTTVNSGGATDTGTSAVTTIPGLPSQNSVVQNDNTLGSIVASDPTCSNNAMFKTYFGSTIEQFAASTTTKSLPACNSSTCGDLLTRAYEDGWRSFYVQNDFHLNGNNTYGSSADPITLVGPGSIQLNGTATVYGLIFANDATYDDVNGSFQLNGALLACNRFSGSGNAKISYDANALTNLQRSTAVLVRVPGSWRDFQSQ